MNQLKVRKVLDDLTTHKLSKEQCKLCIKNALNYNLVGYVYKFSSKEIEDKFFMNMFYMILNQQNPLIDELFECINQFTDLDTELLWKELLVTRPDLNSDMLNMIRISSPRYKKLN